MKKDIGTFNNLYNIFFGPAVKNINSSLAEQVEKFMSCKSNQLFSFDTVANLTINTNYDTVSLGEGYAVYKIGDKIEVLKCNKKDNSTSIRIDVITQNDHFAHIYNSDGTTSNVKKEINNGFDEERLEALQCYIENVNKLLQSN